jgi:hypothetical protein
MGRRIAPPSGLKIALKAIFGDGVENVVIVQNSWIAWLHGRVSATTRKRRIYLRRDAASFFGNPELMLHEYFHVLLQWEAGDLTVFRYIVESVRNGYWNNAYEIAARHFATGNLARFLNLCLREIHP